MDYFLIIIIGTLGVFLFFAILFYPLKIAFKTELKNKSIEELEKEVFDYAQEYFSFIGEEHQEVLQFKTLIEQKNFREIHKNWKDFEKKFIQLEGEAGHIGRPLLLDYYHWYELSLRELQKRAIKRDF